MIPLSFFILNAAMMRGFMLYMTRNAGYENPEYMFDSESFVARRPSLRNSPLTWVMFHLHNMVSRIFGRLGLSFILKYLRRFTFYLWIYPVGYAITVSYIIFAGYLAWKGDMFLMFMLIPASYLLLEMPVQISFKKSFIYHYVMTTDDCSKISSSLKLEGRHQFELDDMECKRKHSNVNDKSLRSKESFITHVLSNDMFFHQIFGIGLGVNTTSKEYGSGGTSYFADVTPFKVKKSYMYRSNGMLTILDSYDIVAKGDALRDSDPSGAYKIRWQSKVAGMTQSSGKFMDRTHLVHHRLSGAEGGYGLLVPMFKCINTGLFDNDGQKMSDKPGRMSMKYHEDKVFNYLKRHRKHRVMIFSEPVYGPNEVIPSYVNMQLWRVDKGAVYPIFNTKIYNQDDVFSRSSNGKKINIDMMTGEVQA